eukprot:353699-Chlamydomonas_euryale.AAC.3
MSRPFSDDSCATRATASDSWPAVEASSTVLSSVPPPRMPGDELSAAAAAALDNGTMGASLPVTPPSPPLPPLLAAAADAIRS